MRRCYLVCYDIADEKRLNSVRDTVKDYGTRVQFSVYQCELNDTELAMLREALRDRIRRDEDTVMFVDLGPLATPGKLAPCVETLGKPPELRDPGNLIF